MLNILKNIKNKLENNTYKNVAQIRYSLVVEILQALEWDIWNPSEVCYDYLVKNYPKTYNQESGTVNIALFFDYNKPPFAYIQSTEIAALSKNLAGYEKQMADFNYYELAEISVLTDGVVWNIYSSIDKGPILKNLITTINLLVDELDYCKRVLNDLISKNTRNIQAKQIIQKEKSIVEDINKVRDNAEKLASLTKSDIFTFIYNLLTTRLNVDYTVEEVKMQWERIVKVEKSNKKPNTGIESNSVKETLLQYKTIDINIEENNITEFQAQNDLVDLNNFDPTFTKISQAHIFEEIYKTNTWKDVYAIVAEKLIERFPDTNLCGFLKDEEPPNSLYNKKMPNGKCLMANYSTKDLLLRTLKMLEHHGHSNMLKVQKKDVIRLK
ncbi:MAG: hypothetical protein M0Q88_07915 [Bacilli bacterium]|nr:hypothetical protein [Bacilli bacterium]